MLTGKSAISLSLAMTVLAAAGYVWGIQFKTDSNSEAIKELKIKQSDISAMKEDIAVIKEKLVQIERALRRK